MAINWSKKMIDELKLCNNITEFAEKYGMSYNSARAKKKGFEEVKENKVEIVEKELKVELKDKLEEVNASNIAIIPSLILDMDSLIEKGVDEYLTISMSKQKEIDLSIIDISHALENDYENISNETKINMCDNVGKLRRKRRFYKDEIAFISARKDECTTFINFIKEVRKYSEGMLDRVYTTRVLKEELGVMCITNENNSELKSLRNKIQQLEKNVIPQELKDRLLSLEKFNLKQQRKAHREAGQFIAIDKLLPNWSDLFNKLDAVTKNGIIQELSELRATKNKGKAYIIKEVEDFLLMNDDLPRHLVRVGYFLKK